MTVATHGEVDIRFTDLMMRKREYQEKESR